jgi:hypothetical protein
MVFSFDKIFEFKISLQAPLPTWTADDDDDDDDDEFTCYVIINILTSV